MENKRVFLIVLDSVGIGEMPDAYKYGDAGSNTLRSVVNGGAKLENLKNLGIFNIDESVFEGISRPKAAFARLAEKSMGKDTTIGHWEISGVVSSEPLPVFPNGFPIEMIETFTQAIGRGVLCNKPYSGTEVIADYGMEHIKTGSVIVYTSTDSVFQVAAHESVVSIKELYSICEIARGLLVESLGVGRVIARPFDGEYPNFKRTTRRHDISLSHPQPTMLDVIVKNNMEVIGVGKIFDIFAGKGISKSIKTKNNSEGIETLITLMDDNFNGLVFINLVDFDMLYGHRNDVKGYAKALMEFDSCLPKILSKLTKNDLLIITADHGCDPEFSGTDHTREYVPLIIAGPSVMEGANLGTLNGFDIIAAITLAWLGVDDEITPYSNVLAKILA